MVIFLYVLAIASAEKIFLRTAQIQERDSPYHNAIVEFLLSYPFITAMITLVVLSGLYFFGFKCKKKMNGDSEVRTLLVSNALLTTLQGDIKKV